MTETRGGDLTTLKKSEPLFNFKLGDRIVDDLATAIAGERGADRDATREVLNRTGQAVQRVIGVLAATESFTNGIGSPCRRIGQLTGEERALAAMHVVMELLKPEDRLFPDTESNLYQVAQQNESRMGDKRDIAFGTMLVAEVFGGSGVGTEYSRASWIGAIAGFVADGPSVEDPRYEAKVRFDEKKTTLPDGREATIKERVVFLGGGETNEQYAAKGGQLETRYSSQLIVANLMAQDPALSQEVTAVVKDLRQLLGVDA